MGLMSQQDRITCTRVRSDASAHLHHQAKVFVRDIEHLVVYWIWEPHSVIHLPPPVSEMAGEGEVIRAQLNNLLKLGPELLPVVEVRDFRVAVGMLSYGQDLPHQHSKRPNVAPEDIWCDLTVEAHMLVKSPWKIASGEVHFTGSFS